MILVRFLRKMYCCIREKKEKKTFLNTKHDRVELPNDVKDMRKYGFSMSESYLYDLKNNDYKQYISTWESLKPRRNAVNPYFIFSDDKYIFYLTFGRYIKTPMVLGIIKNGIIEPLISSFDGNNLYDFFVSCNGGVIKDANGCDGFSVYVFYSNESKLFYKGNEISRNQLDDIIRNVSYAIIQERIMQGNFENNIFNKSINTLRIVSIKNEKTGKHEIVGALQRIGTEKSYPVDNFNQGGLTALIDIKTGMLGKATSIFSIDSNGSRVFYSNHPDNNAKIEGSIIPNWNKLPEKINYITTMLPFYEYIAWDFVVQDDDFALIEINTKSSCNVFQIHHGMRNELLGIKYKEKGYIK